MFDKSEDPRDIDSKIEQLNLARTSRVVASLKAGIDPDLLKEVVSSLDSEIEAWHRRMDQVRELQQLAVDTHGRLTQLQNLAERADAKLKTLSRRDKRAVIEALDLKVRVLGWHSCELCGGAGKLKGGCGGTPCPSCYMVRYVPELRVDGVWTSDLDVEEEVATHDGDKSSEASNAPRLELPFSIEAA